MDQLLLDIGIKEGIFAVLFIWLLYTTMKKSQEREDKLYTFLEGMKTEFAKLVGSYEKLSEDVDSIRKDIELDRKNKKGEV